MQVVLYRVAELLGVNAGCAVSCGRIVGCEHKLYCVICQNCRVWTQAVLHHVAELSGVNASCAVSCGRSVGYERRLSCIVGSHCKWYHCYEINRKPKSFLAVIVGVSDSAVPLHNVQNSLHQHKVELVTPYYKQQILSLSRWSANVTSGRNIQGVPGGMCQTSGGCSLC